VGEENDPRVANEVVEVDVAGGGLGVEVGGNAAEAERSGRHDCGFVVCRLIVCVLVLMS
jgi:hypothetical protein